MISVEVNKIMKVVTGLVNIATNSNVPLYTIEWWLSKDVLTLLEIHEWIDTRDNTLRGISISKDIANEPGTIALKYKKVVKDENNC